MNNPKNPSLETIVVAHPSTSLNQMTRQKKTIAYQRPFFENIVKLDKSYGLEMLCF